MSRVFWVRHGPTHATGMVGWSDLPADLGDTTRLARLSAHLPGDALVISSDLARARATADAIAGPRPRLNDDPDLREIHFGDWELQPFDTIPDQPRLRAFWDAPGDVRPPGGESWHEVSARVGGAVARLRAAHPGRDIVAVAHMGTILTQVQAALGITAYEAFGHRIDPLSVTDLQWHGQGWRVGSVNHCP
ncbi:histidine phosphatase family protein [Roseovarius sp. A46]|uniref:histidine phosphatase family protein n=1 Tax=Roseovarius sp. A46 TaxID=2109331 RepID=UPI001011B451|nr:histidine phosphatase family protein [Roseovarius sp. A46]RXV66808.1 histidine phosphatase family protein [Roseovarius sp. A46]